MSIAVTDFLKLALMEIRVARAGDDVSPDDNADALLIFNELLDALNVNHRALYSRTFSSFTLTPALQPHTIGVTANTPTFTVTIGRPTRVLDANLVLTNVSPNVRLPLTVRDDAWWADVPAQGVTSAVPTDLYYEPKWPNGAIYLWPVPTTAYGLEIETETLLAQVALTDTFDLPFGYQQALRLTLAELLAPVFGQQVATSTATKAREARARIWGNNDRVPAAQYDAGSPTGTRSGGYNYRTGQIE